MTKSNESTAVSGSPFVAFCHSLEKSAPATFVFLTGFPVQQLFVRRFTQMDADKKLRFPFIFAG
jgi:hypothetical protein